VKNENFYSELLSGLVNKPDLKSIAKIVGDKLHSQLKTEIEIFILEKEEDVQLIFDQSTINFSKEQLRRSFLKNGQLNEKVISPPPDIKNLSKTLHVEDVLFLPFNSEGEIKGALILGRNKDPFSGREKEDAAALLGLFLSSAKIVQSLELNKAIEMQLIQKQKFESLGKLTSGIAHDFSNLLSSIFGSVNLLKKKIPENNDALRLVENIENCSARAKDLASGLLAYGKPKPKQKEILSPNQLANEITGVVKQTFPATIDFHLQLADDVFVIKGNSTQIYQVLLNLCINARDAVEKHGWISLSTKNVPVEKSNANLFPFLPIGNFVCISVADNGSGITSENLSKIFDPYFSTKEKESSSGLGLYISYGIIKAHEGVIQVSSIVNQGSRFDIYLPAYESSSLAEKKISEKIILIADDEVMLQDLLAELLESHNYYVIKVSNGKELLQVLTEEIKADLAIIDYNMPEMNGAECIAQIRKLGFTIPVILSSGSLGLADRKELSGFKVDAMVSKPYDFDTMLATVEKLL
jgi:signal transduction histidine kinase/CheY-like chemotaxis protein